MKKIAIVLSISIALLLSFGSLHATDAKLSANVASSPVSVSHDIWNTLLGVYVAADGSVNYKGFKQSQVRLDVYLDLLAKNPPQSSWSKDATLAYWINAYNAFTVQLIVKNYPLESITKLDKPWDTAFITLGGKSYSLNDIEHKVIRVQFDEPRIHFAVNCASESCPPLLNEAYTAEKLEAQLTKQAKAFINNAKYNALSGSKAQLSQLFDWYKSDFTKKGSLVSFLNQYADKPLSSSAQISYKEYNWDLNE